MENTVNMTICLTVSGLVAAVEKAHLRFSLISFINNDEVGYKATKYHHLHDRCYCVPSRFHRDQSPGPGAPVGVLLAGGADDRPDVEVSGPPRETYLLP